jgi:hypothetical protein
VSAAERAIRDLRVALATFGRHGIDDSGRPCGRGLGTLPFLGLDLPCTCGLAAALEIGVE